jgi:hypothetical protein
MCTLISSTHSGNTRGAQENVLKLSRRNAASARPTYAIQRGTMPVRSDNVHVEIMNTPAILIVYTCMISLLTVRPNVYRPESISRPGSAVYKRSTPPETAAEAKSVARNRRPLPKNTVAKELVLLLPQAVADHGDEPQERDARKRQQVHGQAGGVRPAGQPRARVTRVGWHGDADQHEAGDEQQRKQDARDRSGPRGPQL